MDAEKINEFLAEVPSEIRNAVKPLNNNKSWAILIALLKNDRMRFNELKEAFNAHSSGEIGRYLKALIVAGLVEKRTEIFKDIDSPEKTFYYPSYLSKALVRALLRDLSLSPQKEDANTAADGGEPQQAELMSNVASYHDPLKTIAVDKGGNGLTGYYDTWTPLVSPIDTHNNPLTEMGTGVASVSGESNKMKFSRHLRDLALSMPLAASQPKVQYFGTTNLPRDLARLKKAQVIVYNLHDLDIPDNDVNSEEVNPPGLKDLLEQYARALAAQKDLKSDTSLPVIIFVNGNLQINDSNTNAPDNRTVNATEDTVSQMLNTPIMMMRTTVRPAARKKPAQRLAAARNMRSAAKGK